MLLVLQDVLNLLLALRVSKQIIAPEFEPIRRSASPAFVAGIAREELAAVDAIT